MARTALQSACPQCGAPISFGSGHSLVNVCAFCRSTIARAGVELSTLGRVPDLVTTDTRLELGCSGKVDGRGFLVLGRTQLNQGQASWDEWYVSWDNGDYGWLAEARGRLIITRALDPAPPVPPWASVRPGQQIALPAVGDITVEEVGVAKLTSAAGELPFVPLLAAEYQFVDASAAQSGYVTLDYGDPARGEAPQVFAGRELSYVDAGLAQFEPLRNAPRARAEALSCLQCGAPLSIKAAETQSVICPSCRSVNALSAGKLKILGVLAAREDPPLALGSSGTLFEQQLEVLGWLRRGVYFDEEWFEWNEYLLHGQGGYRWLSESNGHWVFLTPIAAASVQQQTTSRLHGEVRERIAIDGRVYRHFQSTSRAMYRAAQGELYWQFDPEEAVDLEDFVAPPYMASCERSGTEVNWSQGQVISGEDVWRAFDQKGSPPPKRGVGPSEVNPYAQSARDSRRVAVIALVMITLLALIMRFALPHKVVLSLQVPVNTTVPITLSEPFEISGGAHALEIFAYSDAPVRGEWLGLNIELIEERSARSQALGLELMGGESSTSGKLGSVAPGRYVLRVEPKFDPSDGPNTIQVRATHGVFLWFPLFLACSALLLPAIIYGVRRVSFEARRWQDSDHGIDLGWS